MTRVKVCCIANADEMRLAVSCGASAVGLVSAMPSGPGPIEEGMIAEIARATPPGVAPFLLTCEQSAEAIAAQQQRTGASVVQLTDGLSQLSEYARLRRLLPPGVKLVAVIHVAGPSSLDEARHLAPLADALLLDSGNPALAVKELGGTGRVHDWAVSRALVQASPVPVWLAGGLTPANVANAIRQVRPFGVDVCSGLRTNGALDETKLRAFMQAVRDADREAEYA